MKQSNRATILLGAIISCFIGFYNGYPLVYPDTGSYLSSGFSGEIPMDRTIFYGLFARHVSISASPWLIVFVQGLISSWILHVTFGMFFAGNKRNLIFLGALTFITLTTGYSFNVSILIPDIFSPIALLCLINLLFNSQLRKSRIIIVSLIFIFSISTHLSNIPTFMFLLLILLFYSFTQKIRKKTISIGIKKILYPLYLLLFVLILVPSVHSLIGNKFQYSSASHVFMVNHLIECGVMEQYLDDKCENSDFKICDYKNNLGWNFIWDEESALYKTGGWVENRNEYNRILSEIYSTPKYWPILAQKTIEYSVKQFFTFDISEYAPQLYGSAPFGQIDWRFHDSVREYLSSKQNNNKLDVQLTNSIQVFVMFFSLIIAFAMIYYSYFTSQLSLEFKWVLIILLVYGILNSVVCSNLSTVDPRFQNRWIWILPVIVIIGLIKFYEKKHVSNNT